MRTEGWPVVVTVAGSDSSGNAGIQADLRALLDLRCHAATAITAVTSQSDKGITRVDVVPPEGLAAQLDAIFADGPIAAVKTGMLATQAHIDVLVEFLSALEHPPPVVVDPVLQASTGGALLHPDALPALRDRLIPLATIVTPNQTEAARLGDLPVATLVTGGDADGNHVIDVLRYPDGRTHTWRFPRIEGSHRGTGCTLASALAARLAYGIDLETSIDTSIAYVRDRLSTPSGGSIW